MRLPVGHNLLKVNSHLGVTHAVFTNGSFSAGQAKPSVSRERAAEFGVEYFYCIGTRLERGKSVRGNQTVAWARDTSVLTHHDDFDGLDQEIFRTINSRQRKSPAVIFTTQSLQGYEIYH